MTRARDPVEEHDESVDSKPRSGDRMSGVASTADASADYQHLGNQQVQALHRAGKLHPSVEVGRSDDIHEQEADQMADEVMTMDAPSPAANGGHAGAGSSIRRKSESHSGASVSDGLVSSLGEGKRLDPAERSYFEPRFGMDFDDVRVHAGPEAAKSAASIQASAYTLGSDVVFGEGRYQPGDSGSRRLLAHELAHVAQERGPGAKDGARPVIRRDAPQGDPDAGPAEEPVHGVGLINADGTDLYDRVGQKQKVLATLDKDAKVTVTREASIYYRVTTESGVSGYVLRSRVNGTFTRDKDKRPEEKKPEEKKPEKTKAPNPYQGIIDRALKTATTSDGESFYLIDNTFGVNLLLHAKESKALPIGFGGDGGWGATQLKPVFKSPAIGWKPGDTFRALFTFKGNYMLAILEKHPGRQVGGKVVGPPVADGLGVAFVFPDWEQRLTAKGKMPP